MTIDETNIARDDGDAGPAEARHSTDAGSSTTAGVTETRSIGESAGRADDDGSAGSETWRRSNGEAIVDGEADLEQGTAGEAADTEPVPVAGGLRTRLGRNGRATGLGAIVVAAAVILVVAVAVGPLGLAGRSGATPAASTSPAPSSATFAFDNRSVGVATAPVTIEVWADFQCPFCRLFTHGIEPSLMREEAATGKALITYRDFAFLGQESIDAAIAARCAGAQAAFWRYHDLLFASQRGENQGAFSHDVLLGLARFASLDVPAFTTCLADPGMAAEVRSETATGRSLGIASTPTVRIVGPKGSELITGVTDPATIEAAVARGGAPLPTPAPSSSGGPSGSAGGSPGTGSPGASSGAGSPDAVSDSTPPAP